MGPPGRPGSDDVTRDSGGPGLGTRADSKRAGAQGKLELEE